MNEAQRAFVLLSALFLICGTVLLVLGHMPAGVVLLSVSGLGWLLLSAMIGADWKSSS